MGRSRSIKTCTDWQQLNRALQEIGDDPTGVVTVEAGAEVANVRELTLQVRDRLGKPWPGRWLVWFFLSPTENGDPSASGNSVAVTTGTIFQAVIADAAYQVLTDEDGKIVVELDVSGTGTRWVHTMADRGRLDANGPFVWA